MAGIPHPFLRDKALEPIWEKIRSGRRLDAEDGLVILASEDITGLGQMAAAENAIRNGEHVFFSVSRQINPTNICALSCRFCMFSAKKGSPRAYELSVDECLGMLSPDLTEAHIVGGLHPDWPWERYIGLIRAIRERYPRLTIKAWTAVEIDYFARKFRKSHREVLAEMAGAGVSALPGGGAEIFSERVRREMFPGKIGYPVWREIHTLAHGMGLRSNASILYGHIETDAERADHMLKIREIQDETGGFDAFIPLAFQAAGTGIVPRDTSPLADLRMIACARLMLDNVPHVKAYWVMIGEETASVALNFGASDMDGTIGEERVAHAARAQSPQGLTRRAILRLIREAGRIPVERDAGYRAVKIHSRELRDS